MISDMAKVKFNRGLYSKSIVDSLKDGELFFDTNTDTTAAAGNQGIYMGVAQSDGTVKPVKVAIGAKQYMTLIDNTFLRGKELGSNIFMYTDDTDTGLRFAPMVRTGRSGFSLIAGVAGTDNDIFDTTKRAYSLVQMWGGESFGGKITLDGWSEGLKSIKSGEPPDILSFFFPHGFDITSERPGDNTVWDSIVGVYHCKGNYGISNENGRITDVTGLFIDPAKTTNARVGVVINGKTNDDLLTANGSTVSASGFLKNTASAVGTANLSDGAVTTAKIAQEAVTESKIADGAVTKGKLATALQTTIDGAVQGNTLTPILKEIDLTGTDAQRKAKLDQFEADWKALTGSDTLKGARFVALSLYDDTTMQGMASYDAEFNAYRGILGDANDRLLDARVSCSSGSLTITPLFQHLEAVVLRISDGDSNADTVNAANKTSIENYVANLQSLGVSIEGTPCHFRLLKYKNGNYTNYAVNVGILKLTEKYGQYDFWIDGVKGSVDYDTGKVTISFNLNTILKAIRHGFEAITIYTDNTDEHMQANLDNIAAYEANLQALRVDVTKGFSIPVYIDGNGLGFLCKPGDVIYYMGVMNYYGSSSFGISIDAMGTYYSYKLQTETNNSLTTTSKQIVDAINEVNAAVKTKANSSDVSSKQDKLVSGTNIKTVNGQSLLGSGDITVSGGKKSVTIAIDNLLDTESFTLTADQAAAFADPDTDIMIESYNGMILPLHIYYMQPGDTTKVYARTYDGDILGVTGQGTDILMFMIDGTTLTIQNAILPYKLVLSTTQSNVALSDGGDTLFTKLSTCDIHDITIDVGGLGFVYLPVLYRGKATDDEYTFVYHNYLDSTAGYAYHAIVMTKTSDNVTFEVTTVTNSLTDTEIANIWDSVS